MILSNSFRHENTFSSVFTTSTSLVSLSFVIELLFLSLMEPLSPPNLSCLL